MKHIMLKILSIFAAILALILSLTGCSKKEKYDNYSIGLNDNGYYKTLSKNERDVSFSGLQVKTQDVLEWGRDQVNKSSDKEQSVDEYVESYAKEVLASIGAADKEVAEIGDVVTLLLDFYIDDKQLEGFYGEKTYSLSEDSDDLVKSALGHKKDDEYESEYTFDEKDPDYASKKAVVKIKVVSVLYGNPLTETIVKNNLDEINKIVEDVTDLNSFLINLRPKIAEALLFDYVSKYIQNYEQIQVPSEYVEFEVYRLKARLEKLGYTYDEYLKETDTTDEETLKQCEKFARENYIIMLHCKKNNVSITDAQIDDYFGESKETAIKIQGASYMKLTLLREVGISNIIKEITLLDDNGNKIEITSEVEKTIEESAEDSIEKELIEDTSDK